MSINPDSILQNINENRYLRSVRRKSAETYYPQAVNVHEIENIRYESTNDIMEMISIFKNLQNSNVKFVKKIIKKLFIMHYGKCDECTKISYKILD